MKTILFYVEPMPIRNTYIAFKHYPILFSKFILESGREYKTIIYANYQTLHELSKKNSEFTNYFEIPTHEEQVFFESLYKDWETEGIELWLELYHDSVLSQKFVKIIENIYSRNKFDYIVCWGTNDAVRMFASNHNIGFINLELGCSRLPYQDTIVGDHIGVNGDSFLSKCHINDIPKLETHEGNYDLYYSMNYCSKAYEDRFKYISESIIDVDFNGYDKIYLIVLQLSDDANMLKYSNFENINSFLHQVLPKISNNSLCIIKEHPLSKNRIGSINENFIAKKYASSFSNVVWLGCKDGSITNAELLTISDCVITINSSFGFEALLYEKPVIIYGDAVYKLQGVFPTLEEYQNKNFDIHQYKNKIAKLRSFFLDYYLVNKSLLDNTKFVYQYLSFIGDISLQKNKSKQEVLEQYVEFRKKLNSQV